jgi:hypothetical protein
MFASLLILILACTCTEVRVRFYLEKRNGSRRDGYRFSSSRKIPKLRPSSFDGNESKMRANPEENPWDMVQIYEIKNLSGFPADGQEIDSVSTTHRSYDRHAHSAVFRAQAVLLKCFTISGLW